MDEMEMLFSCLDEEETEELLKNITAEKNPELSQSIKNRLDITDDTRKAKIFSLPMRRILPIAAVFAVTLACTLAFGLKQEKVPTTAPSTTEISSTQKAPEENPLMVAISNGNDDMISKLLALPGLISQETLDFALNFTNLLSYDTIHEIALSTREALGSTGLDSLLEGALLGDSEKVLEELKKRDKMLMTPFEKLAFFFAVAFCDSEAVDEFVKCGYDINAKDASGNSIYAIAEKYGNEDTMQYALSKGITA